MRGRAGGANRNGDAQRRHGAIGAENGGRLYGVTDPFTNGARIFEPRAGQEDHEFVTGIAGGVVGWTQVKADLLGHAA